MKIMNLHYRVVMEESAEIVAVTASMGACETG
jgi:hypothetical protein